MKRSILALVFASLVLGPLMSAKAAVETYDIDPVHTWVGFTISHFFTKVPGYFGKLKGTIVVDRDHLENTTTEAVIEVASITTNTRMRDDDLRSTNFFAAAKFPAMTFKSKAKEALLTVTSLGFGQGMKGATISGWEASVTLDRRDFDIAADQGMIGNSVDVVIHVEADLRKAAPATP